MKYIQYIFRNKKANLLNRIKWKLMNWHFKQEEFEGKIGNGLFLVTLGLLAMWIPVVIDKITDFASFRAGILNQPFADDLGYVLIYALPILELLIIILLIGGRTNGYGVYLSAVLMLLFTGYVAIALAGAWKKLPCGCGSVISGMTWKEHFFFNLFFLALSLAGIYLSKKQRSSLTGGEAAKGGSAKRLYKKHSFIFKKLQK